MNLSSTAHESPEQYPYWRRNMWVACVASGTANIGYSAFYPYLPFMVREMGFTDHLEFWVGLVAWLYFFTSIVFTPIWGVMADHFGQKSMVLRAGFGMAAGFTLAAFAPGLAWLIPAFLLAGACNGFIPAAGALLATNTPMPRMGRALSTQQIGGQAGNIIGPALGAFLAALLPAYRYLFLVPAVALFSAGGLALLLMREAGSAAAGPLRLHLVRDTRQLLRVPNMPVLLLLTFLFHFTVYGATPVASVFTLQLLAGKPPLWGLTAESWVGIVAIAVYVSSILSLPLWGWLLDRYDPPRMLAVMVAAGLLGSLPLPWVQNPWQLAVARLLFGMCAAGMQPAVMRMIKVHAPRGMDARALYLGAMFQMLGNGLGPLAAGVIGPFFGLRVFFAANCALLAVGLVLWLLAIRRYPIPGAAAPA